MQGAIDASQATIVVGILLANFGAIVAGYVSMRVGLAELKLRLDRTEKDLDKLGEILGTNRAKAQKEIA